ncbi:cell division protein FtsB [Mergibacter septicus]|uniref:cell division protein FtsB n=1 Tax=Mergibacter septicus TaxID=221402 RepID=UPI001178DE67|nr:cell division protein FtsB [Mergibacter septicus]AWX13992.1 cell division protein FtsB [Mergibacter septicus]
MRLFILVLASILVLFQYNLWFGKNGYRTYQAVQQEINQQKAINEKLKQENEFSRAEIMDLKKADGSAVEERARQNYDMIKPNEIFYRLISSSKQ